ncbi:MAG TPA: phage terminase large subunit [Ktedonobacterales bacterium]|nr:phage terminase large subunit [Ktedonobacterales bacterium]
MSAVVTAQQPPTLAYDPRGGARALLFCRDRECLLEGPANTGKSYAGLWKMHLAALKYPGMHGLLLRKTLVSLKASTLVTFRERILGPNTPVKFWTARGDESAHYAYPNGSKLFVGGMDKSAKIMSTEYDMLLWDEATDGEVAEWEALQTRLRYGAMPYQQAIGACNPQGPMHWINQRANTGQITRILSRHKDNPTVTPDYLDMLAHLTGVRRARLYLGDWAAADGMVYEDSWDAERNILPRSAICSRDDLFGDCGIPRSWPRYLSIDFGYTHPFVCQWWAEDGDGRLYRYREMYTTRKLVQDCAVEILKRSGWGKTNGDPLPYAIITDHDAEDRATLEHHLGMTTLAAKKSVSDGIQAVAARMRQQGDGKPRIFLLQNSLVEPDRYLMDAKKPLCTEEEVESYIWHVTSAGVKEEPLKDNDHGMDAMRYMVAHKDLAGTQVDYVDISPWTR